MIDPSDKRATYLYMGSRRGGMSECLLALATEKYGNNKHPKNDYYDEFGNLTSKAKCKVKETA